MSVIESFFSIYEWAVSHYGEDNVRWLNIHGEDLEDKFRIARPGGYQVLLYVKDEKSVAALVFVDEGKDSVRRPFEAKSFALSDHLLFDLIRDFVG